MASSPAVGCYLLLSQGLTAEGAEPQWAGRGSGTFRQRGADVRLRQDEYEHEGRRVRGTAASNNRPPGPIEPPRGKFAAMFCFLFDHRGALIVINQMLRLDKLKECCYLHITMTAFASLSRFRSDFFECEVKSLWLSCVNVNDIPATWILEKNCFMKLLR